MKVEVMDVTPAMAQKWIDATPKHLNRHITKSTVDRYARDLKRDLWRLTGDTMKINCDGTIVDGHHRCLAIIQAGIPMTTLVVFGVQREEVFDLLDQHKKRSAGDLLSILGTKNYHTAAAISRAMCSMDDTGTPAVGGRINITSHDVVEYYRAHSQEIDTAATYCARHDEHMKELMLPGGVCGSMYILYGRIDRACRDAFLAGLLNGTRLTEDSPIYRLRARLIQNRAARTVRLSRRSVYALCFKAWNHYRAGNTLRTLMWRPETEPFPVPE